MIPKNSFLHFNKTPPKTTGGGLIAGANIIGLEPLFGLQFKQSERFR